MGRSPVLSSCSRAFVLASVAASLLAAERDRSVWPPPVHNTGLALGGSVLQWIAAGDEVFVAVGEANQGADLNGDGDLSDEVLHRYDCPTGVVTNLGVTVRASVGLRVGPSSIARQQERPGRFVVFVSDEADEGADLNQDGDQLDWVLRGFDREQGTVVSTQLALPSSLLSFWRDRELAAFFVSESAQGATDLNGDGDTSDRILHVWRLDTGAVQDVGVGPASSNASLSVSGSAVLFAAREADVGDSNGDGDLLDDVVQVYDAAADTLTNLGLVGGPNAVVEPVDGWFPFTVSELGQHADLNGDGDQNEGVLHVYDHASAAVTNTARSWSIVCGAFTCTEGYQLDRARLAIPVPEATQGGQDLNGDGDTGDLVLAVHERASGSTTNLGVAPVQVGGGGPGIAIAGLLAWSQHEFPLDLNGDGDTADPIVRIRRPDGSVLDTGLAGIDFAVSPRWVAVDVDEVAQGADLDGNGEVFGEVLHAVDGITGEVRNLGATAFATRVSAAGIAYAANEARALQDWNGDGDTNDLVLHVFDGRSGRIANLRVSCTALPGAGVSRFLPFVSSEASDGVDLDGDGDLTDFVLQVARLQRLP